MIGWIKSLFRRTARPELPEDPMGGFVEAITERCGNECDGACWTGGVSESPPEPVAILPDTLHDALDDQRRAASERLVGAGAVLLSDEESAALNLARHGREQWTGPSRADKIREDRGYSTPPRAPGGPISPDVLRVAAEARAQIEVLEVRLQKAEADLRAGRSENSQLRNENKSLQEAHETTRRVLVSYTASLNEVGLVLNEYKVPIENRRMIFKVADRVQWLGERAKRRKKTTPRRRV